MLTHQPTSTDLAIHNSYPLANKLAWSIIYIPGMAIQEIQPASCTPRRHTFLIEHYSKTPLLNSIICFQACSVCLPQTAELGSRYISPGGRKELDSQTTRPRLKEGDTMLVEWTPYVHMQSHVLCYDKTTSSGSYDSIWDCSQRAPIVKADHLED
jgi:hypothetical protein